MSAGRDDYLIWLDLEMTGLEPDHHVILEIGCLVTDAELNVVAEGPCFCISQPESILSSMDPWSQDQHGRSGLTQRCRRSTTSAAEAEEKTLTFLRNHCIEKASPLCGNSIGQDRRFLYKYMPRLNAFFHYRNVDVSTIKELVRRWYPDAPPPPEKAKTHHVFDDIRDSIAELKHYRKTVFRS
jgi:oligoribonuclease